jgi:flagellar motor switch protein FliM
VLVEGPGARFGLVVLDAQAVAALIEIQTTGRVVARPADPRPPTRTDAIMCADFVDRWLELVEQRVAEAELEVAPALSGFRYGLALAETRAIVMTLEDIPYRAFRFEVDLGRGAKSGSMQMLLPFDPPGAMRAGAAETAAFAEAMRAQVLETQAVLTATILKRRMTLADIARFEVGTRLVLPRTALNRIAVEAMDGTVVAEGRLGQVNGHRAVRLTVPETGGALADMGAATMAAPLPGPAALNPPPAGATNAGPRNDGPRNAGLKSAGPISAGPTPPDAGRRGAPGLGAPAGMPPGAGDLDGLGGLGDLGDIGDLADLGDLGDLGSLGSLGD